MKIDKKKVVFASIIGIVVIFIVTYSTLVFVGDQPAQNLEHTEVPDLKEVQKTYSSKLKAINDLKEERRSTAPSLYPEEMLDSASTTPLRISEKEQAMDSLFPMTSSVNLNSLATIEDTLFISGKTPEEAESEYSSSWEDIRLGHKQFFHAALNKKKPVSKTKGNITVLAEVFGRQRVKNKDRLELVLIEDVQIQGTTYPKGTLIYGFVKLQPNRLHIGISHIGKQKVQLEAFDLQDGSKGIYVENSFRARASKELLDDVVQEVQIAGIPQIGGLKNIFRKKNRNIKITVMDKYQLILKLTL